MKEPNREPVMNTAELHTIEHIGATFLRNHEEWKEEVIYWGPMGCRTGLYLILKGKLESEDIVELMKRYSSISLNMRRDPRSQAGRVRPVLRPEFADGKV